MPMWTEWRVILGGKSEARSPGDEPLPAEIAALMERIGEYRRLLARSPAIETAGLVDDMNAAIDALCRLEQSSGPQARNRAEEYRRLIVEIEAEIVATLQNRKEPW